MRHLKLQLFEVTINRVNLSEKWIEFWVEEHESKGARSFDFCEKYGDFLNLISREDQIIILNEGLKGKKLTFLGINKSIIGVRI